MYRGEKYIAISFLLVFLLPILYQPAHVIRHHSHKHNDCVSRCHDEKTNSPVFRINEHCYVCEYEFTVTNLPDEFSIPFVEIFLDELKPAKVQDIFSFDVILHTSPRAPPLVI